MAEQPSASFAENNAALRRGTRTRIAKRRPDFVDPFSLRKKRKAKAEGDELLSALSPCSEEGNLKVKLPQNLSSQESTDKKLSSSSFERERSSSEEVHTLPTCNPKVRVIIPRKTNSDVPDTVSQKLVPIEKPSVKLRLRVKPPSPGLGPKAPEPTPEFDGLRKTNAEQTSRSKVRNCEDMDKSGQDLRTSPRKSPRKSPHKSPLKSPCKVITKVKHFVSPGPVEKGSSLCTEECSLDRSQQTILELNQKPQKKKQKSEPVETLENPSSNQTPIKLSVPAGDDASFSKEKQHDTLADNLNRRLKSEPKESTKEIRTNGRIGQKRKQEVEKKMMTEESNHKAKNPKSDVKVTLGVDSLPIRKRPYMREGRGCSSPILRRSTRNRQRRGHSR